MLQRLSSDPGKILGAVFVLYLCGVTIGQMSFVINPSYLHEEARSLFRYHQIVDPALFAGDYLTSFVDAFPQPHLYEWLTRGWLLAGGDLAALHRLLPFACWAAFLAGVAVAARPLGNWVVVVGAVGIALVQPLYLHQITPATPHAFAFPLLIWGVAALLHGSLRGLVLVTLLSGLLYAATVPLLGSMLAWQILFARRLWERPRGEQAWSLLLLAVTGALSLWLVFGSLRGLDAFGAALEPMQRLDSYPENGPEGRHFFGVFNPLAYVLGKGVSQFRGSAYVYSLLLLAVYGIVAVYGLLTLRRGSHPRAALFAYCACALAIWSAIFLLKPYHSYRFVLYPVFTVMPLLFVAGLWQFVHRYRRALRFPGAVALGLLGLFAMSFDSFDAKKLGYSRHLEPAHRDIVAFAAGRPPQSLFAVWPELGTPLELIPYLARRPLFVMRKLHYPLYEGHLLTMRARMDALINAYLATDPAPVRELYCRWGVDYLVVTKAHLQAADSRPGYFAPFDTRIDEVWRRNEGQGFVLRDPDLSAVALETQDHFVLRLSAFAGATQDGGQADCIAPAEAAPAFEPD